MITQLPDAQVEGLVKEINTRGYGVISNFIPPMQLNRMRAFVSSAVERAGHQYVGLTGSEAVAGSALDELSASDSFKELFRRLYEAGTGKHAPEVKFYQVLRCLTGSGTRAHSLNFHYDSYIVTGLIPVEVPTDGQAGDLIMMPNTRRIRKSYVANLIDKALLDNAISQKLLTGLVRRGFLSVTRIKLVPGSLYFFWGYRSIHTNEEPNPDKVRATALFHYANPHESSRLKARLRPGA